MKIETIKQVQNPHIL